MSSFFGVFKLNSNPINQEEFEHQTRNLTLWQPDKKTLWFSDNKQIGICLWQRYNTQESVFNRHQFASSSRIDNRKELITKLNIDTATATKMADEDFILLAYKKWQEDCVQYLQGDFVFAIWDENKKQLFLARDQVGFNKVIYYYYKPNDVFIFASNIRPILEHPSIPRELNETELARYLTANIQGSSETFYKNIYRLPAGHTLTVTTNNFSLRKYHISFIAKKIIYTKDQEYVEHFNEIFRKAIKDRLRSYTPVGVTLSGGLDSSSIAAVAAREQNIVAYGAIPPTNLKIPNCVTNFEDCSSYIDMVTNYHPNIKLIKEVDDTKSFFNNISRYNDYAERPCWFGINRTWLEKAYTYFADQKIRVVLTGQFGNGSISYDGAETSKIRLCLGFAKYWSRYLSGNPLPNQRSLVNFEFANAYKKLFRKIYIDNFKSRFNTLNYSLHPSFNAFQTGPIWEAIFGIEVRDPTADINVLKFCCNIPTSQYCDGTQTRWLIKRAMQGLLPNEVIERKKLLDQALDWRERFDNDYQTFLKLVQNLSCSPRGKYFAVEKLKACLEEWARSDYEQRWQKQGPRRWYNAFLTALLTDSFLAERFGI